MTHPTLSVVIPVYNEQESLPEFLIRIRQVMQQLSISYELIFVDDGSLDRSWEILQNHAREDLHIQVIRFSRNFGHQIAITAGMDYAHGEAIVVIDADLQDPPELIADLFIKWREGYKVVYARRAQRKGETWFKKVTARAFYRILNRLSSVSIPMDVGDFRLIDRSVADALKELKESSRFVRGLVSWVGFKQIAVEYVREPRYAGKTKYPLHKMLSFAIGAIISFSYKPLRLATYLGFSSVFVGVLYLAIIVCKKLFTDELVAGWASLMAVTILYNGVILLILGILGEYIGRIFSECKHRPLYIIDSVLNGRDR